MKETNFMHLRPGNPFAPDARGGITIAFQHRSLRPSDFSVDINDVMNPVIKVNYGVSICSFNDNFDKKYGCSTALSRIKDHKIKVPLVHIIDSPDTWTIQHALNRLFILNSLRETILEYIDPPAVDYYEMIEDRLLSTAHRIQDLVD